MITLLIIGIIALIAIFVGLILAGGVLVVFIDPIIAILIIIGFIKLVKWFTRSKNH